MDYEQKYAKALWQMKELYNRVKYMSSPEALLTTVTLENTFPELKESEDERIRKALLEYFGEQCDMSNWNGVYGYEVYAWLEKQKPLNNFDEAEKEKNDFVSGQFIECRKSFNEFEEDNSYWLEYIGDDTYIGRSDNVLNQKFHITPRQLFTLFTHQHCPKEEKQGKQKTSWSEEDKSGLGDALWAIKQARSIAKDENDMGNLWYAENWLKSIKDRIQSQPKQEWSEFDRILQDSSISYLCNLRDIFETKKWNTEQIQKCIDWLKSLKPNHWKPSEEQKECLRIMIDEYKNLIDSHIEHFETIDKVTDLYYDLKRL